MSKKIYKSLAWFFSTVVAAGTLIGCGAKKYGPPPQSISNSDNVKIAVIETSDKTAVFPNLGDKYYIDENQK